MACCAPPHGRLDFVVVSRRGSATAPSSASPGTPWDDARDGRDLGYTPYAPSALDDAASSGLGRAASTCADSENSVASSSVRPTSWTATGSPSGPVPQGTE